ncbi:hypothetical protein [Sphingobacterium paucimobilis]|uniref:Uncharacterized protein n=1 Tax=Sphingobacterium paucimobilis HER1398 TaxID=1346330 RepID=U2HTI1_9SPHI|nr:hypothetical protein [Sphingobacterium paucimobilis]ERJ58822.1 hypothetical protein M472_08575 [Sphingobacterium paucimobilis HER1398]
MKNIIIDFSSTANVQKGIVEISNHLMNHAIVIGNSNYVITEFEFYIMTPENGVHHDGYTYEHPRHQTRGKFFLHASGVDITFGDDTTYAGILLRGAIKLSSIENPNEASIEKYINGPINLADELVHQIDIENGTTIGFRPVNLGNISFVDAWGPRVGLKKDKFNSWEDFIDRDLRFLRSLSPETMSKVDTEKKIKIRKIVSKS